MYKLHSKKGAKTKLHGYLRPDCSGPNSRFSSFVKSIYNQGQTECYTERGFTSKSEIITFMSIFYFFRHQVNTGQYPWRGNPFELNKFTWKVFLSGSTVKLNLNNSFKFV